MAQDSLVVAAFAQPMILFAHEVNIQMAFRNAVLREHLLRAHFFNPVSQFSTTVTGDEGPPTSTFTIRNFLPSRVTSYRDMVLAAWATVGDRNNA